MKKNFYAIRKGHKSNVVVKTWDQCKKLVDGYSGAIFKGFQFEDEAIRFAENGNYGKHTPKTKPKKQPKQFGKCIERKSYTDPFTGVYYKNRCVLKFIKKVVGIDYVESFDTSCPF